VRLDLGFEVGDYVEEALVETAVGGDGFLDGDVSDICAFEDGDAAPLLLVHHVDCMEAVALAEKAIVGRRRAAALGVAEVDGTGFKAGFLLDELSESFADAGETGVAERIDFGSAGDLAAAWEFAAFRDDDEAVGFTTIVVVLE